MTKLDLKAEPGKQEIVMTRVFNAPREKVFKAFTDPAAIAKWWGGTLYHDDRQDAGQVRRHVAVCPERQGW